MVTSRAPVLGRVRHALVSLRHRLQTDLCVEPTVSGDCAPDPWSEHSSPISCNELSSDHGTKQNDIHAMAQSTTSCEQETLQQVQVTAAAPAGEKEFIGRTGQEWSRAGPSFGSITLVVFGCLHVYYAGLLGMSECSGIPSLPAYAIIFGILSLLNGLIPFVFRTEKAKIAGGDGGVSAKVVPLVGISILGGAIWGAVITWGEMHRFGNSPDCKNQLYIAGFISSAIALGIVTLMLLGCVGLQLKQKFAINATDAMAKIVQKGHEDQDLQSEV